MTDGIIVGLLALIVTLIAVMTPIIKLNSNITTLNCNLEALFNTVKRDEGKLDEVETKVSKHTIDIENAKKDIKILYRKTDELSDRKE